MLVGAELSHTIPQKYYMDMLVRDRLEPSFEPLS